MSSQVQDTEQLLERIRRLEALVGRSEPASGGVDSARREGENRADICYADFRAQNVNTSGRDLTVVHHRPGTRQRGARGSAIYTPVPVTVASRSMPAEVLRARSVPRVVPPDRPEHEP
jgi:hypothetical protein